jgi:hypothetical protein
VGPQVVALAVVVFFVVRDGGFSQTVWYPGAAGVLGVALVAALAQWRGRLRLDAKTVSVALFAAFAVWSFLSIAWAQDKGVAWDGANRTALYVVLYALFALGSPRLRSLELLVVAFAVAVAVSQLLVLVSATSSGSTVFIDGRMAAPAEYANATAGALLVPAWCAIGIAVMPAATLLGRCVALAAAGVLLDLSFLTESRGSVIASAIAGVFLVAWSRERLVAVWTLAALGLSSVVFVERSDVIKTPWTTVPTVGAIHQAERYMAVTAVVLALGCAAAVRGWRAFSSTRPRASSRVVRAAALATVAVVLAGAGAGAVRIGSPTDAVRSGWRSFKSTSEPGGELRFASLGSNRYDFWRVALVVFRDHPVTGVGSENFASDYTRLRRSQEEPAYPHSLVMQLLQQTGLVGTLLFAGFVVALGIAAARVRAAPVAIAGAAGLAYFLIHAGADWLWEFPAIGGAGFAAAGLAVCARVPAKGGGRQTGRAGKAAVAAVLVACALSFVGPWAASRDTASAGDVWPEDPALAFHLYDRAANVDPLADAALVAGGVVAGHLGETARMTSYFERAVSRNPGNWFSRLELAVAHSNRQDWAKAQAEARQAQRLNPREPLIRTVRRLVDARRAVSPHMIESTVTRREQALNR